MILVSSRSWGHCRGLIIPFIRGNNIPLSLVLRGVIETALDGRCLGAYSAGPGEGEGEVWSGSLRAME